MIKLNVAGVPRKDLNIRFAAGQVVISGKFVQKDKYGSIKQNFTRSILLPTGVHSDGVVCKFSSDGLLKIVAKKKKSAEPSETDSIAVISAE